MLDPIQYFQERLEKARGRRPAPAPKLSRIDAPPGGTTRQNLPRMVKDLYRSTGMSKGRAQHSMEVADLARNLADSHGVDPDHAWRAGLVHDLYKDISPSRSLRLAKQLKIPTPGWRIPSGTITDVLHASIAAKKARSLGLPRSFADAIGSHSNGFAKMTPEAKVLFVADGCVDSRGNSPAVDRARDVMHTDLDAAVSLLARESHKKLALNIRPGRNTSVGSVPRELAAIMAGFQYRDQQGNRPEGRRARAHMFASDPAEFGGIIPPDKARGMMDDMGYYPHDLGYMLQLVPDHMLVQKSLGKIFGKIDSAKNRNARRDAIIDAFTKNSRDHVAFRTYLPALLPLIWDKYGDSFKDAAKKDGRTHDQWRRAAAFAQMIDASGSKNMKFLKPYFRREWLNAKIGKKTGMFRDKYYDEHYRESFRRSLEYPEFLEIMNKSYEEGMYSSPTTVILPIDPKTGDIMVLGDFAYF